jgi:hypothetical protein
MRRSYGIWRKERFESFYTAESAEDAEKSLRKSKGRRQKEIKMDLSSVSLRSPRALQ